MVSDEDTQGDFYNLYTQYLFGSVLQDVYNMHRTKTQLRGISFHKIPCNDIS